MTILLFSDGTPVCTRCGGEAIRDGRHWCADCAEEGQREHEAGRREGRRLVIRDRSKETEGSKTESSEGATGDTWVGMLWDL